MLAQCWLEQGTCDNVLLLQIESCSPLSEVLVNYGEKITHPLPPETAAFADSKAQCQAACLLLGNQALSTNARMRISMSSSSEKCEATTYAAVMETPLPDPLRVITAVLKPQNRQPVTIYGITIRITSADIL